MATDTSTAPGISAPGRASIAARSLRTDRWWIEPTITAFVLLAFIVYATWAAFVGDNYFSEPYISPFYSPCLATSCADEGAPYIGLLGDWWPFTAAIIILPIPLGFRLTCYYYRKAYYRAAWQSPPACAVPERHKRYTGETRFPLVLQNLHRYFLYLSTAVALILTWDFIIAFRNEDGEWFHMGMGTLVLLVNAALLWVYTLSCHSCRHIVGGRLKHFSKHPVRYWMWAKISVLNRYHMQLAWVSLMFVGLTDLYIRLVASGTIDDLRFF